LIKRIFLIVLVVLSSGTSANNAFISLLVTWQDTKNELTENGIFSNSLNETKFTLTVSGIEIDGNDVFVFYDCQSEKINKLGKTTAIGMGEIAVVDFPINSKAKINCGLGIELLISLANI
jgi:hypothetical protein